MSYLHRSPESAITGISRSHELMYLLRGFECGGCGSKALPRRRICPECSIDTKILGTTLPDITRARSEAVEVVFSELVTPRPGENGRERVPTDSLAVISQKEK